MLLHSKACSKQEANKKGSHLMRPLFHFVTVIGRLTLRLYTQTFIDGRLNHL